MHAVCFHSLYSYVQHFFGFPYQLCNTVEIIFWNDANNAHWKQLNWTLTWESKFRIQPSMDRTKIWKVEVSGFFFYIFAVFLLAYSSFIDDSSVIEGNTPSTHAALDRTREDANPASYTEVLRNLGARSSCDWHTVEGGWICCTRPWRRNFQPRRHWWN